MIHLVKRKEELGWDITNNVALDYDLVDVVNPALHDEVTTVAEWNLIAKFCRHDYIKMRNYAKDAFVPSWSNLSVNEKAILVSHYLYPADITQAEFDSILSREDQISAWIILERDSKICREKRWEAVRRKISFFLSAADGLDLYITTRNLSLDYKDADTPEMMLWVTNGSFPALGIDYTTNGFAQKSYYTTELRDMVIDIIVNGNY